MVIISRDDNSCMNQFGLIYPGNLFMLMKEGWVGIDTSALSKLEKDFERGIEALLFIIRKVPVNNILLDLTENEIMFFETVIHDIIIKKIDWLPYSNTYCLLDNKIITIDESRSKSYLLNSNIRQSFINGTPQIMICPALLTGLNIIDTVQVNSLKKMKSSCDERKTKMSLDNKKKPKLIIIKDCKTKVGVVPDSVFVKAAKYCEEHSKYNKNDYNLEKTDNNDWFDEITKSANPDITYPKKDPSEIVMEEIVDSIFSRIEK